MEKEYSIEGTWAWLDENRGMTDKHIEFKDKDGILTLTMHAAGAGPVEFKNLELASQKGDDITSYFFTNQWKGKSRNRFFGMETQFVDPVQEGVFINVSEYEIIDNETMKQKLFGYRFDPEMETWMPFSYEKFLKRVC